MADRFQTSIVIPVFNEAANLEKLLAKINALELAGAEIVVVDDGSTDGSAYRGMAGRRHGRSPPL